MKTRTAIGKVDRLVPEDRKEKVLNTLLRQIESLGYHFDTGILATPLLLKVLTENNYGDVAYKLITQRSYPSFGHYITRDEYSCLWEDWHGNSSRCHPMFGSVVAWFYDTLLGIRYDSERPGMKHIIICPRPIGDLSFCKGSFRTTATLFIPKQYTEVMESGKCMEMKDNTLFLGSGVYHFIMK